MLKHIIPLILFFILTPGILWSYSKKHNKYSIALLHASVFAFVFYFINTSFDNTIIREGLNNIKGISFKLEKNMNNSKVNENIKNIVKIIKKKYDVELKVDYDNKEGVNDLIVSTEGDSSSTYISKEDIMDKDIIRIINLIDKEKNK